MTHPSTPPTTTPDSGGTNWGKIILFGCLGLLVVGILMAGIGAGAWFLMRDSTPAIVDGEGDRETTSVGPGDQVYHGTLAAGDRTRPDGSWYDAYSVEASAGERIVIVMESSDFDAYITVVSPGAEQHSDDDSGGGTDARLELEIDESGTWTVMANAYRPGEEGAYTLRIER
ncbi:MAG TPA: hypothetical protein VM778_08280 [Gemmatimonadota bacterium]|nr:hypothetical protein [Gemmatimonadota bacterium]